MREDESVFAMRDRRLEHGKVACFLPLRVRLSLIFAGFVLIGCAVGPDFRSPEGPNARAYTATPLPAETAEAPGIGGAPQRFVSGQDVPAQWWALFRSEPLDGLIRRALADNPTLAAAEATLRQAQENARAQFGALFPSIGANVSAEREKFTGAGFGQTGGGGTIFNLYNASVSVSYFLDIFGGVRRQLEALHAQVDYQDFQVQAAYVTLTSNIVTTAVKEASLRAQIAVTQEVAALQEEQLKVVERQLQLGSVALSDVLAQRTQLAQTRAAIPPLEKQLAQTRHLLAVLAGRFPSEASDLPAFSLDDLHLPEDLPVGLPSDLARRRPDIRASEALLHAASASIGVATANLYPQITLTGNYGSETIKSHV
jgi:NodT family efflux transporter outer membrane factor (OMF) lipoprotein